MEVDILEDKQHQTWEVWVEDCLMFTHRSKEQAEFAWSVVSDLIAQNLRYRELFGMLKADKIDFTEAVHAFEAMLIDRAMRESGGNKKQAARRLGIKRTTLLSKLMRQRTDIK